MTAPRDRAIEAMTRIITRDREAGADPRATASECLVAIEGLGWRYDASTVAVDWRVRRPGTNPGEDYRAALAEVRQKAARSARELGHAVPADLAADETGDIAS
jgi:hypothetical protein